MLQNVAVEDKRPLKGPELHEDGCRRVRPQQRGIALELFFREVIG